MAMAKSIGGTVKLKLSSEFGPFGGHECSLFPVDLENLALLLALCNFFMPDFHDLFFLNFLDMPRNITY